MCRFENVTAPKKHKSHCWAKKTRDYYKNFETGLSVGVENGGSPSDCTLEIYLLEPKYSHFYVGRPRYDENRIVILDSFGQIRGLVC